MTEPVPPRPVAAPLAVLLRDHPEAAFDYLEFRQLVAGTATALAAERATEEDRQRLSRAFQAMVAAHGKDDPAEEAEADADFTLAIYHAAHNRVMEEIMRTVITMLRQNVFYDRKRFYRREGVRDLLLRQHKAIHDAVLARDPTAARLAAERHIAFTRDALAESRVAEERLAVSLRRVGRDSLVAEKVG
jgi:GntR family transcriptional repressor for pyruvate dehydrogenase complex